jgi:GntR family transcriptional regulator
MKNIIIKTTTQTPIYQQLYEQIAAQIANGDLLPDTLLPSIRSMAKELRVSIITIKKTWELLEQNDYIYTMMGKGSYVKAGSKSKWNKKKLEQIKESLKDSIALAKQMDVTQEELIDIITDLYK